MERKIVSGIMLILLAISMLSIVSTQPLIAEASPSTVLYVDPPEVLFVAVGDSFNITVTVNDVVDLFLAEFYMSFDPAILSVVDDPATTDIEGINFGDVELYLDYIYVEEVNNDEGRLHVVIGRPVGIKNGFSGTVQVTKITFLVEVEGGSELYFYDNPETPDVEPRLFDSGGEDIKHTTEAGYFANVQYAYSCDDAGKQKNVFEEHTEIVYVEAGLFPTSPKYIDIYVVKNTTWVDGQTIGNYLIKKTYHKPTGITTFVTDLDTLSSDYAIYYDIIVDFDQDSIYDAANDAVDGRTSKPGATTVVRPIDRYPSVALIGSQLLAITSILDSMEIGYDVLDGRAAEDIDQLLSYAAVIFYCDREITMSEHSALESYLSHGGNLLVTGYDSRAHSLCLRPLLADLVRSSSYGRTLGGSDLFVVDSTHPIMNGPYGSFPTGYHISWLFNLCDVIKADTARGAISVAELADGYDKIIAANGLPGKAVFWNGFGPSDWTLRVDCEAMFKNTLAWFMIRYEHDLAVSLVAPDSLESGDSFLLRATVYNIGLNNETDVELQLLINSAVVKSVTIPKLLTGCSYPIVYLWTPTVETVYNVTANALPLPNEAIIANNRVTQLIDPPIPAAVDVNPNTLNLMSKGEWITTYIQLPEGYNPEDIEATTILLNETIQPVLDPKYDFVTNPSEYLVDHNEDGIMERMVKFNRTEVASWIVDDLGIQYGSVTLTITGELFDGTPFEGTGTIKVLFPGDVDDDGDVDLDDLYYVLIAYGTSPEEPAYIWTADFNEDGQIDLDDLYTVAINYGNTAV